MAHLTPTERLSSTPILSAMAGSSVVKLRQLADGRLVITSTRIGTGKARITDGPYPNTAEKRAIAFSHFHRAVKAAAPARRHYVYDTASTAEQPPVAPR